MSTFSLFTIVALSARPSDRPLVRDTPDRLSDQEFWRLTTDLSEADASFISDNLVSNEMSFAQVIPQLNGTIEPGGVYLGVGPEQNFSYLSAMRARIGFIIDIRRGNLLLQLMYKALFELSGKIVDTRQRFIELWVSRSFFDGCPHSPKRAQQLDPCDRPSVTTYAATEKTSGMALPDTYDKMIIFWKRVL